MAIRFDQLIKAQQLRDRAYAAGLLVSVSQMAQDLDGWTRCVEIADAAAEAARAAMQPSEAELLAERKRLLARVAEIDSLLSATSFICPRCGKHSSHPADAKYAYCGACHKYPGFPPHG